MSILNNAVASIQIGVEDFRSPDSRRQLSAVRNVAAGIALLFKEKLRGLSPADDPELLIRTTLLPHRAVDGELRFRGTGRKTVDVQQIKERFGSLGVDVDWRLFDKISGIRNDMEHYYTEESKDVIREALASAFVLIRDFTVRELGEDPLELFGPETWTFLLQEAQVYAREEAECRQSMSRIDWRYNTLRDCIAHARCPKCNSSLVRTIAIGEYDPALQLQCASCGAEFSADEVIEGCIGEHLGAAAHIAVKDGGEPPFDTCPECGRDTYVFADDACLACEYTMEFQACSNCEASLSIDDQSLEGLCSYCHYKFERMRDEK